MSNLEVIVMLMAVGGMALAPGLLIWLVVKDWK